MEKLLNGSINECGVIVPFNDTGDIIFNNAEDSLLFRRYRNGNVRASIRVAEFDDGEVACSSDVTTSYEGYSSPLTMRDKKNRETAIQEEKDRIVRFLKQVIEENRSEANSKACSKVLEQIYYDAPMSKPAVQTDVKEKPLTLPLVF